MLNTRDYRNAVWQVEHWLPVPVGLLALVIIFLWFRPFAFGIAFAGLLIAAVSKLALDAVEDVATRQEQLLDAGSAEFSHDVLLRARAGSLVLSVLTQGAVTVCSVASLLAVMHWYK